MRPVLLELFGLTLFSYPLFLGFSWGFGYNLSRHDLVRFSGESKGFTPLFLGVFLAAWLGSKIFFLIYSLNGPRFHYLTNGNFWMGGGFVFYGGLFFGAAFLWLYCGLLKRFPLERTHIVLPALCFAHAIGRLGCFLAGCCFGTHTELPLSVTLGGVARHPVQLYEAVTLLALGFLLRAQIKRGMPGEKAFFTYFLIYGAARFVLEYFRGDFVRGISRTGLSTSQTASLCLVFVTGLVVMATRIKNQESRGGP